MLGRGRIEFGPNGVQYDPTESVASFRKYYEQQWDVEAYIKLQDQIVEMLKKQVPLTKIKITLDCSASEIRSAQEYAERKGIIID